MYFVMTNKKLKIKKTSRSAMYQPPPELWAAQPPANLAAASVYQSQSQDYKVKYVTQTQTRKVHAPTPQRQSSETIDIRDPHQYRDVQEVAARSSQPSPIPKILQSPSLNLSQLIADGPEPQDDSMLAYLTKDDK